MQKQGKPEPLRKAQVQPRPGYESKMSPIPQVQKAETPTGKLKGKVALITGGDSGIGRAVAVLFACEGALISICYLNEHRDAKETKRMVDEYTECILLSGDLSIEANCKRAVKSTIDRYGKIDIVVNNAALHYESKTLEEISSKQLIKTFTNNVFPYFWISKAALPHLSKGSSIINTASVTAYRGSDTLIDYASTKGAIVSFTRSLSSNLVKAWHQS